jgi:hypothetical protein
MESGWISRGNKVFLQSDLLTSFVGGIGNPIASEAAAKGFITEFVGLDINVLRGLS